MTLKSILSGHSRSRPNLVADFETTTTPDDCRVWAYGIANINNPDIVHIGKSIDDFITEMSTANTVCSFHNLKFDGWFILDWLLNNGYIYNEWDAGSYPKSFKAIISDMGMFYAMAVTWESGRTTEFRDSLKKIPMPVARIAKTFGLAEGKGEIDYHKHRPVGYEPTPAERDYIRRDVSIIAHAMASVRDAGMDKLTIASDSMAEFKRLVGSEWFRLRFPKFTPQLDAVMRGAYRGGFTYADPRFRGRMVGSGVVLDVNSLYPYVMKDELLPYGRPHYVEGKVEPTEDRPLTISTIEFTAKLKPGHIPCIQIKNNPRFSGTEYLRVVKDPIKLTLTNIDFELYLEHYDIEVHYYHGGWQFRAEAGMFDSYIDKWSKIKESATGGEREIAKLHLNSLYGKFASRTDITGKIPELVDGVVKLVTGPQDTKDPIYTPVGAFITAHARSLTIRAAQANYSVFAYADTDSLHLITDTVPTNIDLHPTKMGKWSYEYAFDSAYFIRPKAYIERLPSGNYKNAVAGLPVHESAKLTFDDVVPGKIVKGKLRPKSVPGGLVLLPVDYDLGVGR